MTTRSGIDPLTAENIMGKAYAKRGTIFLIISIICVLAINSLLPIIEGTAHYTEAEVEVTYGEYLTMVDSNDNYALTWKSRKTIEDYKERYIKEHPDMTSDEQLLVKPNPDLPVSVYTKFFFEHPYWWLSTATNVLSMMIIFYALFNYLLIKKRDTHERYLSILQDIQRAVDEYLDPTTFEPWMNEVFNKKRKIQQHRVNVRNAIESLNRKTPYKVRIVYDDTNKKHRKYKEKLRLLEEQLEDDYIEKYVLGKRVKHFKYIYPSFVTAGYNSKKYVAADNYSLLKSDGERISGDSLKKIGISVLFATMLAVLLTFTIGASFNKSVFWIITNVITKIVPLVIQVPMASSYCETFMNEQVMTNVISRRNIALLYLHDYPQKGVIDNAQSNQPGG